MAVIVGTTSERWLQGLDRLLAATAEMLPVLPWRQSHVPTRWVLERGSVRASAPVDALGGFPGSLSSLNCLTRTTVIATDRYLVVGEGESAGFALPLTDIKAVHLVRPSRQVNPGLVIHYHDGASIGTFALQFRGLARGLSGRRRSDEIMRVLRQQGVPCLRSRHIPRSISLAMPWDEAQRRSAESLIWSGSAKASVGGWYGAIQRACKVWLTEESLFWCCSEGEGVNRLALADITEVRDGVADRVRVAFLDAQGDRYDIAFDFSIATPVGSSARQRIRFLNVLASCGVAVSAASGPLAPWRSGGMVRPSDRGR